MRSRFLLMLMFAGLAGCGEERQRQPTAEEIQRFTRGLDRAEAAATANAIVTSRAKEEAVARTHVERLGKH
jgi:hypothetical protein